MTFLAVHVDTISYWLDVSGLTRENPPTVPPLSKLNFKIPKNPKKDMGGGGGGGELRRKESKTRITNWLNISQYR